MVKQYTENQYDDDLTLSNDDYNESYYTDADDLFEFSTDDESPISRLKSLVLSIDWEITDEVLLQFNEELLDLKGIWAGESVNLVYVQALEKISKYIYQNKADSHPNAIKLLLTFYYNLEKIVSSQELSEEEKKDILLEDVKKFEVLKRQIKHKGPVNAPRAPERPQPQASGKEIFDEDQLLHLKAIVLGIDWEITDQDLNELRREVVRLEEKFAENRPQLILLQGIGTLAAYIKVKKSNAHPDAFKVMQLFYESLEKIVEKPMSLEDQKGILFPAVEKFNAFKSLLGTTISPDVISRHEDEPDEDFQQTSNSSRISPALADVPEEEVGFQAEREAMALGLADSDGVASHIEDFFGGSEAPQAFVPEPSGHVVNVEESFEKLSLGDEESVVIPEKEVALQGVDVGGEDDEEYDSKEDKLRIEDLPPLDYQEESPSEEPMMDLMAEPSLASEIEPQDVEKDDEIITEETIDGVTEKIFSSDFHNFPDTPQERISLDREIALQGVDVETDADDDSDELSLPMDGAELAPALAAEEEVSLFSATTLDQASGVSADTEEIVDTIDDLFQGHDKTPAIAVLGEFQDEERITDTRIDEVESEELIGFEDWLKEDGQEEASSEVTDGEDIDNGLLDIAPVEDELKPELLQVKDIDTNGISASLALSDVQEEDTLNEFFAVSDLEQSVEDGTEIDSLFDSLETDLVEEKIGDTPPVSGETSDAFFDSGVETEESVDEILAEEMESAGPVASGELPLEALNLAEEEVVFDLFQEESIASVGIDQENEEQAVTPISDLESTPEENLIVGFTETPAEDNGNELAGDGFTEGAEQLEVQPLRDLQVCIDSLKFELSDTVIVGLFDEIRTLRNKFLEKPLEKTFLQLLSTIIQHIDSYRYESSAEAHGLLVSVYEAMVALKEDDQYGNQEALLLQTLKVLDWQQGMLSRQAVKKGNQLIFADPIRTETEESSQEDAQEDFDALLEHLEDSAAQDSTDPYESSHEEDVTAGSGDFPAHGNVQVGQALVQDGVEGVSKESYADDLKKEIASLRQTLQMEIAELRRELKKE